VHRCILRKALRCQPENWACFLLVNIAGMLYF
jgi:hypothetical protein